MDHNGVLSIIAAYTRSEAIADMLQSLLEPIFQPFFDREGRVYAYEALMRLKGRPFFSPARLIKRWERTGYIVALDLAMVRKVGELLAVNGTKPRIAVNVSIVTVETAGDAYVRALIAIAPLARLLIVELTETVPIADNSALLRFYAACRGQGFAIALDDCRPGHLYGTIDACEHEFISAVLSQLAEWNHLFCELPSTILRKTTP